MPATFDGAQRADLISVQAAVAAGAGGFSRVGGGALAHANIVAHRPLGCKPYGRNLFNNTAGPLLPIIRPV